MEHLEIIVDEKYHGLNPVQFGHEHCEPSYFFGPAVRQYWLLHYVVSGNGKFVREGVEYEISAGDIFVVPPFMETFYQADEKNPWHYIWIGFVTDIELPEEMTTPIIKCTESGSIFTDMLLCHGMGRGKSAYLSGMLWRLVSAVLENKKSSVDYIEKALSFIHSEYMNKITVKDVADKLGFNRSYFTVLFKERVGVSPMQYLIDLRLEKAEQLMTVHGHTPTAAAFSVGYDDIYHFSKAFRKKFGAPPRVYINKEK